MSKMLRRLIFLGQSCVLGAALWVPSDANACGGLFCDSVQPVVQTGERIIFAIDKDGGIVHAIININYQGAADDFAWVLPLLLRRHLVRR